MQLHLLRQAQRTPGRHQGLRRRLRIADCDSGSLVVSSTPSTSGSNIEAEPAALPPDLPPPDDHDSWNKAAQEFQETVLESVQSSAETWNAALLSLIGLFGTVSIVVGAEEIKDVGTDWVRWVAIVIILIAGLCAGMSVWYGTKAQTTPDVSSNNWNGEAYRAWIMSRTQAARGELDTARFFGAASAALIFGTGLLLLIEAAA
jgi:hypothetical protein